MAVRILIINGKEKPSLNALNRSWHVVCLREATWRRCKHCSQYHQSFVHYSDVIMSTMASQITSLTIVYSTVYSSANQRKHQSFASLAFVRGIHWWPVDSQHKWPVTRKMFPFDDVSICYRLNAHPTVMLGWWDSCLTTLTLKLRETHGCIVSTVATDALVLKHQAISIHNAD